MSPPELFDRNARVQRRARGTAGFLGGLLTSELLERLDMVARDFRHCLILASDAVLADTMTSRGMAVDSSAGEEDRLVLAAGHYDLILVQGRLDTVSDLPGALLLLRRALRPDGLLLASLWGAPSLTTLRRSTDMADEAEGLTVARYHPLIDVRSAGDLLVRAGFALPVADVDTVKIAYSDLAQLIADLRAAGATSVLPERYPVSRAWLARAAAAFQSLADAQGRTGETFSIITLTGWGPSPDQPQPAKRGSATASLAQALRSTSQ